MLLISVADKTEEPVSALINVQISDTASDEDLREAWQTILNGTLEKHLFDALYFECIKRSIDPSSILPRPERN